MQNANNWVNELWLIQVAAASLNTWSTCKLIIVSAVARSTLLSGMHGTANPINEGQNLDNKINV